mmetsp:Transcript_42422/g.128728  ORF Transcript_42422/g.128728 Transcript_42422/m.128728 type:complete len:124 (-) Transcript_42422:391-762(-)
MYVSLRILAWSRERTSIESVLRCRHITLIDHSLCTISSNQGAKTTAAQQYLTVAATIRGATLDCCKQQGKREEFGSTTASTARKLGQRGQQRIPTSTALTTTSCRVPRASSFPLNHEEGIFRQ